MQTSKIKVYDTNIKIVISNEKIPISQKVAKKKNRFTSPKE